MNSTNATISHEFSKGNFKACYDYFAQHIKWNVVGNTVLEGKEAVVSFCESMLKEMVGSTFNNTNSLLDGNKIAVEGICSFTDAADKPATVLYSDFYTFDGDKIVTITSYCI